MNTDRPTPASRPGTTAEPAAVDESAEPTVALSDTGDGEPTVNLAATELSEKTVDLSSSAQSEPTADPSAVPPDADASSEDTESEPTTLITGPPAEPPTANINPEDNESEPTVTLSTTPIADEDDAEETAALPAADESEPTVTLAAVTPEADVPEGSEPEPTATLPTAAEDTDETVALSAADEAEPTTALVPAAEDTDQTVALPAADEAEPTTALVPAAEDTDQTVALPAAAIAAAADEAEPTTVIIAGSEPTIALPKPRVSPESTVALPVSRVSPPDADPTVALPIPAKPAPAAAQPGAASRVTLPSVPAPRTAPTVTPPPSEPTIALPAAPVTPVVVPPQVRPLSRRRLLWAIPAVAGTALVGGTIAALAGRDEPEAAKGPKTPNLQVSEPAPSQFPSPSPTPNTPQPTAPIVKDPVHTLADFRKLVPGDPFPADSIALTIDDGPHPVWTPKILRLLEKHHVPAMFFMIGNQVLGHESTARDVATDGHLIANHTWSHPINLSKLPPHKSLKEIHRAQDKIYSTTGKTPSLFRAPGGAWSKGLSQSVSQSNVIPIDWTNDPRDWAQPGVAHITNRMLAAQPGQILLIHDGGGDRSQTLASLRTVIPALQAKGLKFVALM
ncbi:polysaccharide deacetylase family protein [Actinoplanes italicus]|nr:polysaccharide deacetylase family protein [Actinoplanes italicus]